MNTKNSSHVSERLGQVERGDDSMPQPVLKRKPFVEPVVSVPIDVLEATAFFQSGTIGTGSLSAAAPSPTPAP